MGKPVLDSNMIHRNPETKAIIQGLPNLMGYAERVHEEYFSDYKKWE
jgi:hypothetical protein